MIRLSIHLGLLLSMLFITAPALAGDALPDLAGKWQIETIDKQPPEEGVTMYMSFVDDANLRFEATFQGKTTSRTIKYAATKDGKLVMYPEPDKNPDGDKATWKITDGKLYITSDQGEVMVLKRAS